MSKAPYPLLRTRDPELQDWVDSLNFIVNAGHYQFGVTNTIPDYRSNTGESRVYISSDGLTRALYVYIDTGWVSIPFDANGNVVSSGFGDHIINKSGNTLVHTEYTNAEDQVRFYTHGAYVVNINTYGLQVAPEYKVVFDGLGGDTYWTYSSASTYMQCYLNGTLRMEM